MRPWFALLKALLNVNFGYSALRERVRKRERILEIVAAGAGVVVAACSIGFLVGLLAGGIIDAGLVVGQPELALTMAHLGAALVVFFFGVAFVIGTMYFAGDTARLLAWPLRPWQIVSAKVVTILVNEYLTMAVILIPVYVVYAIKVPVSGWYVPAAVLAFLLTPIVPLVLAALLAMVLMRVAGGTKRRDLFAMIGGIAMIILSIAIQYFLQTQMPSGSEAEFAQRLFARVHGLSEAISRGYPPSFWAMQSMAEAGSAAGWLALLKLALTGIALFLGLLFLGEAVFLRAAQSSEGTGGRRKAKVEWRSASAVSAIARADLKLFLRTPVFVLNGLTPFIIVPVLMLLPIGSEGATLEVMAQEWPFGPTVGSLVIAGWYALATCMSVISATAFSREGSRLWILKSLPVSGRTLLVGKLRGCAFLTLVGALPGAIVFAVLIGLPVFAALVGILLGSLLTLVVSLLQMTIDMIRPRLDWTHPAQAAKQNSNVLLGMFTALIVCGALVLLGIGLSRLGVSLEVLVGLAFVVTALVGAVVWRWVEAHCDAWLARMGDS